MRAALWLACALALMACGQSLTVEQQVINTIREMESKLEAGQRIGFMAHLADEFRAQDGGMSREEVRALVVFQLQRYEQLQGRFFPIRVTETGPDTAEARFRALVTGGAGLLPESGRVYDFETWWRLDGGGWLLTAANWDPVPLDEVLDELPLPEVDY